MQHSWIESIPMETASFGDGWEGRVIEGRFPLLKRLGGTENCGLYFTVLQGMQEAIIQLIATDATQAETDLAQWTFAQSLTHPNLARVLAAGQCVLDGKSLVYVVGEPSSTNLAAIIESGPIEVRQAKEIFDPIVDALKYLHGKGVVHGHLNPANIHFAGSKPRLLLTDLVIAGDVKRSISEAGNYDAPEMQNGIVTAASDIWSLGLTIWEAMTQAPPFADGLRDDAPEVPRSLPSPFREIVQECLRRDPARRGTLDDIQAQLGVRDSEVVSKATPTAMVDAPAIVMETVLPAEIPRAASEISVAERPVVSEPEPGRFESEASSEAPLFSGALAHFEEAHLPQSRVMPYVFVLLAVIAIGAVWALREHRSWFSPAAVTESGAAVSASAAQKQATEPVAPAAGQAQSTHAEPPQPDGGHTEPATEPGGQSGKQPESVSQTQPASTDDPGQMSGVSHPPTGSQPSNEPGLADGTAHPDSENSHEASPKALRVPAATEGPRTELNAQGSVAERIMPAVSPGAREGMTRPVEVLLRVTVNEKGTVADASYVVPGPGNYFARVAQRAALGWKFQPPVQNGEPERSVWMLKFKFERAGTEATATVQEQ